jgi:hypothetical protein
MPAYIQDVLDLIEWANGPATSTWGAKRAKRAIPSRFNFSTSGSATKITSRPASRAVQDGLRRGEAKHPEITVIGTAGRTTAARNYEAGWAFARELRVPVSRRHYYVAPDWFWDNLSFYNRYDRSGGQVYLGEYAAHGAPVARARCAPPSPMRRT